MSEFTAKFFKGAFEPQQNLSFVNMYSTCMKYLHRDCFLVATS